MVDPRYRVFAPDAGQRYLESEKPRYIAFNLQVLAKNAGEARYSILASPVRST